MEITRLQVNPNPVRCNESFTVQVILSPQAPEDQLCLGRLERMTLGELEQVKLKTMKGE